MRATVEFQENSPSLSPVEVTVVLGQEDLAIKVSWPATIWASCNLWFHMSQQILLE